MLGACKKPCSYAAYAAARVEQCAPPCAYCWRISGGQLLSKRTMPCGKLSKIKTLFVDTQRVPKGRIIYPSIYLSRSIYLSIHTDIHVYLYLSLFSAPYEHLSHPVKQLSYYASHESDMRLAANAYGWSTSARST